MTQSPEISAQEHARALQPVRSGERLVSLDIIRGLAVLGILLANVTGFGHVDPAYYWPLALPEGGNEADRLVWLAQFVLVDGKFRGLFTILFGAGMVLFVDRIGQQDRAFVLQLRRLGWLLLFGLAHFYLLFRGDILFSYAIAGVFALFALRLNAERLLAIGIIWAVIGAGLSALAYLTPALMEVSAASASADAPGMEYYRQFWADRLADAARQGEVMTNGSYWDVLRYRFVEESGALEAYASISFFDTIPLMLVGMGLYRSGVFVRAQQVPHWRGLAIAALVAGLAMNLAMGLYVYQQGFPPYLTQFMFFGLSGIADVILLIGGTALFAQWAAKPHDGWLTERLALCGRMAFSNYIGTSLVMVLVFHGWAGGLFGQLHRLEMLMVVLLGWALMIAFSRMWLARFRYGPLEYLWRCLTYWHRFPIRRIQS